MPSIPRCCIRLAGALLLALVLPSTASALSLGLPTLNASGGTIKHYTVSFTATSFGAELDLIRTQGSAQQVHALQNNSQAGVTYTAQADLSSARIVASWGAHGTVSMSFRATGRARKSLPKGCVGKPALLRPGVLTGTLRAKLDKRFFKTIKRTRMSATLSQSGAFTCGAGGGGFGGPGLSILGANKVGKLAVTFVRVGKHGRVTESASILSTSAAGNWTLRHTISETAPSSALKIAADASSASGKGFAPFLSGTMLFRATGAHTSRGAIGSVSGSFRAKFDSIGTQRLARGTNGNVSQP
jgi:hypothetical protein